MAKSNGFFSKRRGSAGSLTFSVLNGKQVTKEKVSSVKNPKTEYQADQRSRWSAVTKFASALRGIVDHSFVGVTYGQPSVNHFTSLATKKTQAYIGMPKGATGFMPQPCIISQGSLEENWLFESLSGVKIMNFTEGATDFADFLSKNSRFKDGDQLTIIEAYQRETDEVFDDELMYHPQLNYFVVDRIVLNATNCATITAVVTENGSYSINLSTGAVTANFGANDRLIALAAITSRMDVINSKWQRSTEKLSCPYYNSRDLAIWNQQCKESYMQAAGEMRSNKYLNQAEAEDAAEIVYSKPTAFTGTDVEELVNNTPVGLAVQDSSGVYHPVYDSLDNTYSGVMAVENVPTIQSMAPTDAAAASEGETVKLISPTLKWDEQCAGAAFGETVTLGAPVKYVDIVDILINA